LERLPGVKRADVKLETGQARVIYDDTKQTPSSVAAAIDKLGFKPSVVSVAKAPTSEAPARR
jgi:copper chaperone CopZ